MPFYLNGVPQNNNLVHVAASQTTKQLGAPRDSNPGNQYLERVITTQATTAVGAVTVLDGDNVIFTQNAQVTGFLGNNVNVYEINAVSQTTEGFNITTGSSVTAVCIGRF